MTNVPSISFEVLQSLDEPVTESKRAKVNYIETMGETSWTNKSRFPALVLANWSQLAANVSLMA